MKSVKMTLNKKQRKHRETKKKSFPEEQAENTDLDKKT